MLEIARRYYTMYALIRRAMQAALQYVSANPDATAYVQAVYDDVASREHHYADVIQRIERGDYAHIDDLRCAVEDRGALLERQYVRREQCLLCGSDVVIDQYRMPDRSLVYLRGCTECGLAYEDAL